MSKGLDMSLKGSVKYWYCVECGYYEDGFRGYSCADIKCPNCGKYTLVGVGKLPQDKVYKEG